MGGQHFVVASWNMRQGIHNSGGRIDVRRRVEGFDADVVILQEAWWHDTGASIAVELAGELGLHLHEVEAEPAPGQHPLPRRVAILSRAEPAARGHVHVSTVAERESRPVAWVQVDGLRVGGTHLLGIHVARRNRLAWRRELHEFADATHELDVVAGDLNMWTPPIRRALGGHRAAVRGRTWPARLPHSQIDHMYFRSPLRLVSGEVLADHDSDHRPIRAVFEIVRPG